MIDLAGIGNLLEYLVAADNITCEERDRIILRIAKENDIAEYTLSALAGYGKSKSEVLEDERNQFLNAIKTLRNELAQADAPEVIEAIINDEKKKIDSAANEYRKSMDILRVAKFGGILTTVITVAADVLGYCSNFPDLYKGAIESSGLWAGILTGIFEKRVGNINNPYTYLAQIKSTFSYYPGASKLFGGQPQIAKYNYTLYRGFEEFIND